MDKYEFNIKVDQIKKLAAKKSFKEAAAIAKEMNWQKVKDWPTLAMVINVQEAVGDYLEARDMAILAYNRNLGGRKLVYKLTELLIKLEDFENADELYEEYEKMSQHDVNRYILFYDLRKAENASDNELVEILEDYKEHEIDEKYMYELAKLYSRTGRREECIKTCDDIVLWFQDGIYVEKAIQLKQQYGVTLTNTQKKILENARKAKHDLESTKEILFEQQEELTRIKQDDVEEALNEFDESDDLLEEDDEETKDIKSFLKKAFGAKHTDDDEEDESEYIITEKEDMNDLLSDSQETATIEEDEAANVIGENADKSESTDKEKEAESEEPKAQGDEESVQDNTDKALKEPAQSSDKSDKSDKLEKSGESGESDKPEESSDAPVAESVVPIEEESKMFANSAAEIDKASVSLKELIENAKKKLENSYEQINKEAEEEKRIEEEKKRKEQELKEAQELAREQEEAQRRMRAREDAMEIEVDVPNFNNLYDTQNIQAEIAKNLKEVLAQEEAEADALRPKRIPVQQADSMQEEINPEDEQIEGQLNLGDWMEAVREKKYGNRDTRRYSKAELDRMLDEKDEKSEAYEKLIAEQKALAKAEGTEFNEEEAKIKARTQMMLHAAKTDLAIRTGKATAKLEAEVLRLKESAKEKPVNEEAANASKAEPVKGAEPAKETVNSENVNEQAVSEQPVQDAKKPADVSVKADAPVQNAARAGKKASTKPRKIKISEQPKTDEEVKAMLQKEAAAAVDGDDFEEEEKKLTGDLAKLFRNYREMPGLESQIADYFDTIDAEMAITTSKTGNIIISGNSSSDKIDLARTIVRAINHLYPAKPKKIAKTTGDSINHRGLTKAMGKLKGTVLIVEGAGVIQPKRVKEIISCLEQDTGRMIVILEDSDAEINNLLQFNPELTDTFNHRIVLKQYTVNELVEMARRFARKRQYEVDDNALLELYLKIDKLHSASDNIKLDDVKEIINDAIVKSEKRASRRFFGGLKKKHGENGDIIFLSEADFKD